MRSIRTTKSYKKDFRREARTENVEAMMSVLPIVVSVLASDAALEEVYDDHQLIGEWRDCRGCHVKDDFLLVYFKEGNNLHLVRLGSHSELYGK
jgi:mRNA interferase YafQ